jgi:serine/threonine protein kinase
VKIVLELMDAGSIGDILRIYRAAQIAPPIIEEPILAKVSQQVLHGLSYLHVISLQIHRDIKPDNVLLNTKGYVKLTDFGISRDLEQSAFCTTVVGTYTYMSPERIEGKKYNHISDIWSFGIMLYELGTKYI